MTLTYSAPAPYVSVFVCEKEQHFILEEVFKKEKKRFRSYEKCFLCVVSILRRPQLIHLCLLSWIFVFGLYLMTYLSYATKS